MERAAMIWNATSKHSPNLPFTSANIRTSPGRFVAHVICLLLVTGHGISANEAMPSRQTLICIVGAAGTKAYDEIFRSWAKSWKSAASSAEADFTLIGLGAAPSRDRAQLREVLAHASEHPPETVWLVMIGHGTYDGKVAKFNLRGADLSATELKAWLDPITVPTAVINCASSSAPFLKELTADHRVIVTATRSGYEFNFAHFGEYLSGAITDPAADLDRDAQVSLLEAYLTASRRVREFYDQETRLMSEHALLDDNGDGLGTPADWFRGLRAVKRTKQDVEPDGFRAHQFHLVRSDRESRMQPQLRKQRDSLERQIEILRASKDQTEESDYYDQLESLLIQITRIYQNADKPPNSATP